MLAHLANLAGRAMTAPADLVLAVLPGGDDLDGYVSTTAPASYPPDHGSAPADAARAWPEGYVPC